MKTFIRLLLVIIVLGAIAAGGGYVFLEKQVNAAAKPGDDAEVLFEVKKGQSVGTLGAWLEREELISSATTWRYLMKKRGGLKLKAGKHKLKRSMTMVEIASALEKAPMAEDVPFTVVEGWRLRDTDAALTKKGLIKAGAYVAAARKPRTFTATFKLPRESLEGYLYPETYRVDPKNFDVKKFIQRQLDRFAQVFEKSHRADIDKSGRSLHELVTMASMLEREEPTPSQRPLVAGILWKRIDLNFALGVDATSRYELVKWNDRKAFLKRLRDKTDRYNTRYQTGLPPTPIGAATLPSLKAAMKPKKSEFLYYLHDNDRILRPSRNAAEHEALRKKYNVY